MKIRIQLLLMGLLTCGTVAAQAQESALVQINHIKLGTDTWLYGICTMPDAAKSQEEAAKELSLHLNAYLADNGFHYLQGLESLPADAVGEIVCEVMPGVFRTMEYVEKSRLAALEQECASAFEQNGREAVERLQQTLAEAQNLEEIHAMLVASGAEAYFKFGQLYYDTPQAYVENGYLIYVKPDNGTVLEIMTPPDASGHRKNARTGADANPMHYVRTLVYWICFAQ